jgi:hypothetical protein
VAPQRSIELSGFFNTTLDEKVHHKVGNDLRELPRGIQTLGGVQFDVVGMIQLAGNISKRMTGIIYPEAIKEISVGEKGQRLHFLQGSAWKSDAGTTIGKYVVHYKDGQSKDIPIVYQEGVVDWWFGPKDMPPADALVAWKGGNERTRSFGLTIQLFRFAWENPRSDVEIERIDFVTSWVDSAPFLIAATIE